MCLVQDQNRIFNLHPGNQLRAQTGYSLEFLFASLFGPNLYSDLDFFLSFFKYFVSICYVPNTLVNKTDVFPASMGEFCLECLKVEVSTPAMITKKPGYKTWLRC